MKKYNKFKLYDLFDSYDDEAEFFLTNFFGTSFPSIYKKEICWKPQIDVYETESEYVVIVELGLIKPDEVSITYRDSLLYLRGVRQVVPSKEKRHYHKMEINYGPFERKIHITGEVDIDNLSANYEDGFLEIRLPKRKYPFHSKFDIEIE